MDWMDNEKNQIVSEKMFLYKSKLQTVFFNQSHLIKINFQKPKFVQQHCLQKQGLEI